MAFIIRSYPRCGTHMLRTALSKHPEITCHNEVFNPDVTPAEQIKALGAERLYHAYTGEKEGFVVHGYTELEKFAQAGRTQELWPIMQREKPTVIIVERQDILRRALSVYQARMTQRWHVWKSNTGDNRLSRPKVQAHELEWQLKCAIAAYDKGRELFPDAHFFTYEYLVDFWPKAVRELQEAIGVTQLLDLQPKTAKQDQRPITEMVSNYRELKDIFANTKYADAFAHAEHNDEQRAV